MAKAIIIALLTVGLIGCGTAPVKLRTEVQEVFKPILYCPAPNWEGLARPELAIDGIAPSASPGEVAKRYKATVRQLEDYADRLEKALDKYDTTNEAYDELRKQFMEQRAKDGFVGDEGPSE